jgi:hypothetical protein
MPSMLAPFGALQLDRHAGRRTGHQVVHAPFPRNAWIRFVWPMSEVPTTKPASLMTSPSELKRRPE